MSKVEPVLVEIAKALNATDVLWAVGASVLLSQYGLIENPSDIDITASVADVDKIDKLLSAMGSKLPEKQSKIYSTEYFCQYIVDGVRVDLMAGLKINLPDLVFEYKFDENSIPHSISLEDVFVPFASLEEWFVLYQMMPNREQKVVLIEDYFKDNGMYYPALIERMLADPTLPATIRNRTKALI